MAHVNPTLSVIMLNVSRLNTPMRKAESGSMDERKKSQHYSAYKNTLPSQRHKQVERKRIEDNVACKQ